MDTILSCFRLSQGSFRERSQQSRPTVRSIRGVQDTNGNGAGEFLGMAWRPLSTLVFGMGEARTDKRRRRKELRLLWPINKTVAAAAAAGMEWNGSRF